MKYANIKEGIFLQRPNRFIAKVLVDGTEETVHVKNTGRCRELLVPGTKVLLEEFEPSKRKTRFDLVSVYKGEKLINMDSQAPNKVFYEFLLAGKFAEEISFVKPEYKWGNSRFDFYMEAGDRKMLAEVKGVTLEQDGVVRFPDAPTERGVRHIRELISAVSEGIEAYIVFVVQMKDVLHLKPNDITHPEFGAALRDAAESGVNIRAYFCDVVPGEMHICGELPVRL